MQAPLERAHWDGSGHMGPCTPWCAHQLLFLFLLESVNLCPHEDNVEPACLTAWSLGGLMSSPDHTILLKCLEALGTFLVANTCQLTLEELLFNMKNKHFVLV